MGINTATKNFKENLTELINSSKLPAVNVLLVLENIQREVHGIYVQQLQEESIDKKEGDLNG